MSVFLKQVSKPISVRQEVNTLTNVSTTGITFTLCDRTDIDSKEANYFMSFNLPFIGDSFSTGNTLSLLRPELQQLNSDRIVIGNIDSSYYDELIDGRTVTFTCPQVSGATLSAKTLISSTYFKLEKFAEDPLLGSNIAFLFCDEINVPYKGTTKDSVVIQNFVPIGFGLPPVEIDIKIPNTASSWNSNISFVKRPSAVSYSQLGASDINSDKRTNANYAVSVATGYPTLTNQGYNYDIPVGFIALDKGFVVLTHPDIVDNFPFDQGIKIDGTPNTGPTSATTNIYFTSTTTCDLHFVGININYKTSILCYIMPGEFYKTTNPSWNSQEALIEEQTQNNGFEPVYISELALHNIDGEVIAYAKLDQPLRKNFSDFVAFTIDLNV